MEYRCPIKAALIGKQIVAFALADDGADIRFDVKEGGPITLVAVGDCCSLTWIESLDAPTALLGTVLDVEEIPMPDLGNIDGTRHQGVEVVDYYGLKITTDKGRCVIDYRNDSNGYYGGHLELVKSVRRHETQ